MAVGIKDKKRCHINHDSHVSISREIAFRSLLLYGPFPVSVSGIWQEEERAIGMSALALFVSPTVMRPSYTFDIHAFHATSISYKYTFLLQLLLLHVYAYV